MLPPSLSPPLSPSLSPSSPSLPLSPPHPPATLRALSQYLKDGSPGPAAGKDVLEIGDLLVAINGTNLAHKTYDQVGRCAQREQIGPRAWAAISPDQPTLMPFLMSC